MVFMSEVSLMLPYINARDREKSSRHDDTRGPGARVGRATKTLARENPAAMCGRGHLASRPTIADGGSGGAGGQHLVDLLLCAGLIHALHRRKLTASVASSAAS